MSQLQKTRDMAAADSSSLPGKKGIGMASNDLISMVSGSLKPMWSYNWSPIRPSSQPDNVEFLPMIWGGSDLSTLQYKLETYIQPGIAEGSIKRVLGFNEPDGEDQANMQVDDALTMWEVMASNLSVPLIGPSCVHADGDWMQEFMMYEEEASWIGVHWYGSTNAASFKSNMKSYYELYNRPLLITEFAPADWSATDPSENQYSTAAVLAFMKQVLPWLEQQDWIAGYAWFPFKPDSAVGTSSALFDSSWDLTDCGLYYRSVNATNPYGDQTIGKGYYDDYITTAYSFFVVGLIVAATFTRRGAMRWAAPFQKALIVKSCEGNESETTSRIRPAEVSAA